MWKFSIGSVGIYPFQQATAYGVSAFGEALHAVRTVLSEEIVTSATPSAAHFFKNPLVLGWKFKSRLIPIDMNNFGVTPRCTTEVLIDTGTSAPPIHIGHQ